VPGGDAGGDIDLLAASLRASSTDLGTFFEVLAEKLERALPGRVVVRRRATRFLGKQKQVVSVQCDLGERRYTLARETGGVAARCATAVRGVVLKSESLAVEDWIDALARDLGTEAQASDRAQAAFQQLLNG
jgi:hypothetical protein